MTPPPGRAITDQHRETFSLLRSVLVYADSLT